MSRNQRLGLVLAAVAVAAIAFVLVSPGSDDDADPVVQTTPAQEQTTTEQDTTVTDQVIPSKPAAERIRIRGGEVVGGAKTITVTKGDEVRLVVTADAEDDIHVHGYDIEKRAGPGRPARFIFDAGIEGEFEIESHVAEDSGNEPLVARLVVEPA